MTYSYVGIFVRELGWRKSMNSVINRDLEVATIDLLEEKTIK